MYLDRRFLRSETWIFIFHLIDSLSLHLHFKFKESKSNAGGKIVSVVVGSGVTTWHGVTATVAACNCGRAVVIARLRGCRASIASSEAQLLVGQG
jgi:hypothetical protein